ncbi:MAG: hypothetical protein WBM40_14715 [Thiohalocapsa sp.]
MVPGTQLNWLPNFVNPPILSQIDVDYSFARVRKAEQGFTPVPASPCRKEVEDLLAIADTLMTANPKLGGELDEWRRQLDNVLEGPIADDLATEARLEALSMDLRYQWITLARSIVSGDMKAPPMNHLPILPVSRSTPFMYERVLGSSPIQEKLKGALPTIPGWQTEVTLFSSGMAAIGAAITVLRHLRGRYGCAGGGMLQLDMLGGYFETLVLLDLLDSSDLRCRSFRDAETLLERFHGGTTDILFLEVIAYDWKQSVIDPAKLLQALKSRPADRPWILMLDTTMLGPYFDAAPLLAGCQDNKPLLVLEVRSGLKLDQVGLEFSNVGIIKSLTPYDLDSSRYPDAKELHEILSWSRKVLGTALSLSEIAVLDAPWIFHSHWMEAHTRAVLDNNRRLALALDGIRGLFRRVNHPGLGEQKNLSWAESPIVVMEFHAPEDSDDNHQFLLAVIAHEVRRRQLVVQLGCSFGFRHHRCEVVIPGQGHCHPDGKPRGYFKVAMGSRCGPSLQGTIELMRELAAFPDFRSLRLAFPQVKPKRELARFPSLRSLRKVKPAEGLTEACRLSTLQAG